MAPNPWEIGFGVLICAGALMALFVWFPADIPTGFFFVNAIGREEPGDAFFPIILACLLLVLGGLQVLLAVYKHYHGIEDAEPGVLTFRNLRFVICLVGIVGCGLALMYGLGPLTVLVLNTLGVTDTTYRALSDTAPYKYIGYVIGGLAMTLALIIWAEGRVRRTGIISVVLTLTVAILIFDVLLKNVLLPPNADF